MTLLELPMVRQIGAMMPEMLRLLMAEPCPLSTLAEMRQVQIPTLIIHGVRDEVSPVDQAVSAHRACASSTKKLVRYPGCHHNDLRATAGKDYYGELRLVCQIASGGVPAEALLQTEQRDTGLLGIITGALRCLPVGMRRCLAGRDDALEEREHPHP